MNKLNTSNIGKHMALWFAWYAINSLSLLYNPQKVAPVSSPYWFLTYNYLSLVIVFYIIAALSASYCRRKSGGLLTRPEPYCILCVTALYIGLSMAVERWMGLKYSAWIYQFDNRLVRVSAYLVAAMYYASQRHINRKKDQEITTCKLRIMQYQNHLKVKELTGS